MKRPKLTKAKKFENAAAFMPAPSVEPIDYDYDQENSIYFWHEVMVWAEKGQYKPLIAILRDSKTPILPNDRWVRDFLADALAGKIKRRKSRPPQLPRGKELVLDWDGKLEWLPKRKDALYEAALWVKRYQKERGQSKELKDKAITLAAKRFSVPGSALDERTIRTWLNRPKSFRIGGGETHELSQARVEKMFKGVAEMIQAGRR